MRGFWEKVRNEGKKVLKQWYTVIISCGIWSLLLYLWSKGIQNGVFVVLNYFTGALLSIDGENIVGGVFGRTIILMVMNTFLASIFMHKGSMKKRIAVAAIGFQRGLKNLNEYVKSFSIFATKQLNVIFAGIMGIGLSLICNNFIMGNGTFINSFPCIALFFVLLKQFQAKTGFFLAVINLGARKLGYRDICGDGVVAFFSAFMSGCLIVPVLTFFSVNGYSYAVGAVLVVIGVIGVLIFKARTKAITAAIMMMLILLPQNVVQAQEMETALEVRFNQGTVAIDDHYDVGSTLVIEDVVVNGVPYTDKEVILQTGDVFSFKVVTNSIEFLKIQSATKRCAKCDIPILSYNGGVLPDGTLTEFWFENYKAEFVFEDVMVYDTSFHGTASGQIQASCNCYSAEVMSDNCGNCEPSQVPVNLYDYLLGTDSVTVALTALDFGGSVFEDGFTNIWLSNGYNEEYSTVFTYGNGETVSYKAGDELFFHQGYGCGFNDFVKIASIEREKEIMPLPETVEDVMVEEAVTEETVMEEMPVEEKIPNEVSPLLATAVIAPSIVGAGIVASVNLPITSVIEAKLGMKKKKGTLHVNGGMDIPTIRYGEKGEVNIPINIVGADELKWTFTVIAMTPDDGKLVKATTIPLGADNAQIHISVSRAPKKEVTTFLQVIAFAVELSGECYLHETMVEMTIEK